MTPHPLYLTSYILYLCHHTHCLGNITTTEFLRSHLLYMMTSYPLYMTSLPLNVCHHTHFFNGITPFICRTSHPLYVSYHIQCIKHYLHILTSHQIIYEITCTLFMISPPLSLKWHPYYLSHHNDSIDGLRPTLCVTSHPLYGCQLMHSTQRHIHSLWLQAIVVITLHPLHSWHQTPYIWDHTHGNTNIISAILPAISNTTSTVSVSSKQRINYSTTTLYDIT